MRQEKCFTSQLEILSGISAFSDGKYMFELSVLLRCERIALISLLITAKIFSSNSASAF